MEKYYNDNGEVGVLYSPGYGAGWSTRNPKHAEFLLFDKCLVELAIVGTPVEDIKKYLKSKGIDGYFEGWDDIQVEFMKPGTAFFVKAYDGYESINYYNSMIPHIA